MAKVKTNPLALTNRHCCSCYVPRETTLLHAVETTSLSSTAQGLDLCTAPPQPRSCTTKNQHVSIIFLHENAEKRTISINFARIRFNRKLKFPKSTAPRLVDADQKKPSLPWIGARIVAPDTPICAWFSLAASENFVG
jgi:hypothetical protein